jgi:tetratricopeptide (TPR) repeat protein
VDWYQPWAGAWVRHADRPDRPLVLDAGKSLHNMTLSPDGKWLVTLEDFGPVKLWDAQSGRLERTLQESGSDVSFSPDGRWLSIGWDGGCLLAVGSWQEVRKLKHAGYFSPDNRIMAVRSAGGWAILLVETETGKELARLEDPDQDATWDVKFTSDGSRLLVSSGQGIRVWDLRRIRAELARRDLDWDAPQYPPAPISTEPLTVELDLGDFHRLRPQRLVENYDRAVKAAEHIAAPWYLRGRVHQKAGRYAEALRDLQEAVARQPDHPRFCHDLARLYVVAPEPFRNACTAVPLAEKAVKLQHGKWAYVNTLGIAYYRAGRYAEALTALQKSLAGGAGEAEAADLYFLALCHHRLGDANRARDCLRRAVAWHETNAKRLTHEVADELRGFRVEAEAAFTRSSER